MYRWGTGSWKTDALQQMADGHMDIGELYAARSFGTKDRIDGCDQAAVYVADNPETGKQFGDTLQTLRISPDSRYLDILDPDVMRKFDRLCQKHGVYDFYGHTGAREDLYFKAGIDVVRDVEDNMIQSAPGQLPRAREFYAKQGFFKVFNPEKITDIR